MLLTDRALAAAAAVVADDVIVRFKRAEKRRTPIPRPQPTRQLVRAALLKAVDND